MERVSLYNNVPDFLVTLSFFHNRYTLVYLASPGVYIHQSTTSPFSVYQNAYYGLFLT